MSAKSKRKSSFENRGPMHSILRGAEESDFQEVDLALAENPNCINAQDEISGITAIHIAAGDGNIPMSIHLLSKHGLDLKIRDNYGRDALDMAIGIGSKIIIEMISRRIYSKSFDNSRMRPKGPKLVF